MPDNCLTEDEDVEASVLAMIAAGSLPRADIPVSSAVLYAHKLLTAARRFVRSQRERSPRDPD